MVGKWKCPKCNHWEYEVDQFQATGSTFTKLFNIQSKKFTTVTCTKCTYTEIYKASTSELLNILDFFTN